MMTTRGTNQSRIVRNIVYVQCEVYMQEVHMQCGVQQICPWTLSHAGCSGCDQINDLLISGRAHLQFNQPYDKISHICVLERETANLKQVPSRAKHASWEI